jgi:hypothetical protein
VQLDELRPEDFEPLLGRVVALDVPGGAVDCELTEIRRLPPHSLRAHPPFALILRGPRNRPLAQGTYPLLHPEHGPLHLFVVPVGPDRAGLCYEITFN